MSGTGGSVRPCGRARTTPTFRPTLTPLAAKVPGYVRQVVVQDFQQVKAGDLLVQMVDDDYRAQLDQAQANVMGAQAAIATIEQQKRLQDALINAGARR